MLNMNLPVLPFSADVLGRPVNEPLEPWGDGKTGPWELPHPAPTDHQEDQRGERKKVKVHGTVRDYMCTTVSLLSLFLFQNCVCMCVQVQEQCQYELVAPLAIMFSSTLLQVQWPQPYTRYQNLWPLAPFGTIQAMYKSNSIKRPLK